MSVTKVKEYLQQWHKESAVIEFAVSSATVALAAEALKVESARIAKSIALKGDQDHCVMIVAAGDAKIDNAKFKAEFGIKAKMLNADEVLALTGYAVGGVCPFAVPDTVTVYLDLSLRRFTTVFPACGSHNSCIELTCSELEELSGYPQWVDVCKS